MELEELYDRFMEIRERALKQISASSIVKSPESEIDVEADPPVLINTSHGSSEPVDPLLN